MFRFQWIYLFNNSLFACFSNRFSLVVFQWSQSDRKSPKVNWTLLSIQVNFIILTLLWSGWSLFIFWFPIPPVSFQNFWKPFQGQQLQLVSPSPSFSTAFAALWQNLSIWITFPFLSFSLCHPLDEFFLVK